MATPSDTITSTFYRLYTEVHGHHDLPKRFLSQVRSWASEEQELLSAVYTEEVYEDQIHVCRHSGPRQWGKYGAIQQKAREARLLEEIKGAETFEQWQAAAEALDELHGKDEWKDEIYSEDYDYELVQTQLHQLDAARMSGDRERMLFAVRNLLERGLGGMGDLKLYRQAHIGTKTLIERFIKSAELLIEALVSSTTSTSILTLEARHVLDELGAAQASFGRTALMLSGGGTFGMSHIGVLKCLWERKLLPRIICGASAGSIVAAVMCCTKDDSVQQVLHEFCQGDLKVFHQDDDDTFGEMLVKNVKRLLTEGALFDISHLKRVMKSVTENLTFSEAYRRTGRILNITISSSSLHEQERLLNYKTAPDVLIWSAVCASCSIPIIYKASKIWAKHPRTKNEVPWTDSHSTWIDGSVDSDLPMDVIAEMFNVNHFIVSQTNPHVTPFLANEDVKTGYHDLQSFGRAIVDPSNWISPDSLAMMRAEIQHFLQQWSQGPIMPSLGPLILTKMHFLISQKYRGDITIVPSISAIFLKKVLSNPDPDFMQRMIRYGEQATWPKLSRIENHLAIEMSLERAVSKIRDRVFFSRSQQNLRRNLPKPLEPPCLYDEEPWREMLRRWKEEKDEEDRKLYKKEQKRRKMAAFTLPREDEEWVEDEGRQAMHPRITPTYPRNWSYNKFAGSSNEAQADNEDEVDGPVKVSSSSTTVSSMGVDPQRPTSSSSTDSSSDDLDYAGLYSPPPDPRSLPRLDMSLHLRQSCSLPSTPTQRANVTFVSSGGPLGMTRISNGDSSSDDGDYRPATSSSRGRRMAKLNSSRTLQRQISATAPNSPESTKRRLQSEPTHPGMTNLNTLQALSVGAEDDDSDDEREGEDNNSAGPPALIPAPVDPTTVTRIANTSALRGVGSARLGEMQSGQR